METVPHWDLPIKDPAASRFVIGQVYVHALLKAHNETTQGGGSPYQLQVVCYAPSRIVSTVTFHAVEAVSLLDSRTYAVAPILVDQRGVKVRSQSLPHTQGFESLSANAVWASLVTDSSLALRPEKNEEVEIRILVEIAGTNGSEKGWITYRFKPRLEEGEVGYIGPGV